MNTACICLTATVRPFTTHVAQHDVTLRLSQYKSAIDFYLSTTGLPIYLLENSGFEFHEDPEFKRWLNGGRLKIMACKPHADKTKGKGFQEFFMLDSFFESEGKNYDRVFKITGRYIIRNIATFVHLRRFELYMDFHKKMKVGITGFFCCTPAFYNRHITGAYLNANDDEGIYIEHLVYPLHQQPELKDKISLMPLNPEVRGVSGSYGASLRRNPYKLMLRNVERMVLRLLGFKEFKIEY